MKSSILIIYTGGTIGMKTDPETGTLVPFDFSAIYQEFPSLKRLNVAIEVHTLTPVIDSSNVQPQNWITLAELIRSKYGHYDGFVVLHGTDTMSYTASALSFMFENLAKPIVFTGSQIPIGVLRTDGRENLITAIEIAGAKDEYGHPLVPEVSLYFQNHLFRANRTTKRSAEALSAFYSYNYPPLADVGVNIAYNRTLIHQPDHWMEPLRVSNNFSDKVCVVKLFPGLNEQILSSILSIEGLQAVVLETYGAGNAPTADWFIRPLEEAIARGLIVLNITQCKGGGVAMELYETGLRLQQIGVTSGYDMTIEAAVTKLMYLLGSKADASEVKQALEVSLRGELSH
ncbi:MAG: type I asparaginase [Rikenellaceae bacterium]|nr:type I asparaginase [Rikenellaceae bacterium]